MNNFLFTRLLKQINKNKVLRQTQTAKMARNPKFHDIASKIFPEFEEYGCISIDRFSEKDNMIIEYVNAHSIEFEIGDILHVGSTCESHPHMFVMVADESKLLPLGITGKLFGEEECALNLLSRYKNYMPPGLYYKDMFDEIIMNMKEDYKGFGGNFYLGINFFGLYDDIKFADMEEELREIYEYYGYA